MRAKLRDADRSCIAEWRFPLMAGEVLYLEKFYPLSHNWQGKNCRKKLAFTSDLLNSDLPRHR